MALSKDKLTGWPVDAPGRPDHDPNPTAGKMPRGRLNGYPAHPEQKIADGLHDKPATVPVSDGEKKDDATERRLKAAEAAVTRRKNARRYLAFCEVYAVTPLVKKQNAKGEDRLFSQSCSDAGEKNAYFDNTDDYMMHVVKKHATPEQTRAWEAKVAELEAADEAAQQPTEAESDEPGDQPE